MADQQNPQIRYFFKEDTNQILVSGSDTVAKTNAMITSSKNPETKFNPFYSSKIVNQGVDTTYMVQNGPEFVSLVTGQNINSFTSVYVDNQTSTVPIAVTGNRNGTGAQVSLASSQVGLTYQILQIYVVTGGSNWSVGETITITQSQLTSAGFVNPTADLIITLYNSNLNIYGTTIPINSDQELWVYRGYNTNGGDGDTYRYNPHLHRAYKSYIVVETGSGIPAIPYSPEGNVVNYNTRTTPGGQDPGPPLFANRYLPTQLAVLGNANTSLSRNPISGSFIINNPNQLLHPFVFSKYHVLSSPPIAGAGFRIYEENATNSINGYKFSTSTYSPPTIPAIGFMVFDTADVSTTTLIHVREGQADSILSSLSQSYDHGKTGGKIKLENPLTSDYVIYDIDSLEYDGRNFAIGVSNPQIDPLSFTLFPNGASLDFTVSDYPQFVSQLFQNQSTNPNILPNTFDSITFDKQGTYTYTSSAFPTIGSNSTPASGSTQFGLYSTYGYYAQYNAKVDTNYSQNVRVFFTSSLNTSSYVDVTPGYNATFRARVGTISQSGYNPSLTEPSGLTPQGTYNGDLFDIFIQSPNIAGTPPIPPDVFAKRYESVYISYSSSFSSSLDGLYVFNQLPQNDVQVTASMFITAWTGSAEGSTYGDPTYEYGTATYDVGEAGDGPTWPTASIRIYTGSYPNLIPSIGGTLPIDNYVTQSEFRDENIHINGLAITMSYLIPSQSISIKDCLSLSLAVSSGSAPSESVENSLVVREYYLEFNTPTSSLEGDGLVPTFVENAYAGTYGFSNAPECQPTLNNALGERRNEFIQEVDYSTGIYDPINFQAILSGSAQKSTVPYSNYTTIYNKNPKYDGSRTGANSVNSIDGLFNGFGTLPVIDYQRAYFAYCDQILDPYPVLNNKIQLNLKYLINSAGDALNPLLSPYTGLDVEQNWDELGLGNVQVNQVSGSSQYDQINGLQNIQLVAKQPQPILYSQTSSTGYTDFIPLEGNPNFVSSFSQSYMQYSQRIGGSVYNAYFDNDQSIQYSNLLAGITSSGGDFNVTQLTSSFANRWGEFFYDGTGTQLYNQIGNTIILNETDTQNWTGSTFPIDSIDTDPDYPNNTATTNPYFGQPGEIFFTIDPIASGSDGTFSQALSDDYKITIDYTQPSTLPDRFRTVIGQGSSWGNWGGTSSQYGSSKVGEIIFALQKSTSPGQGTWSNISFQFTEPPKITVYFGSTNNNLAALDGTTMVIDLASVSSDEGFVGNFYKTGVYENQIQAAIAQSGRLADVVYISFNFKAESTENLQSGVRYRWNANLNYSTQTNNVINNDGMKNYWNPLRVPVKGPGVSGGNNSNPILISPAIKGPFINVSVVSAQSEDNTEDNALNAPYWEFSSSYATSPFEFNYTSSTSQFNPLFNNIEGSGSIRFNGSEFGNTTTIFLAQTSSANQDMKATIDHLNGLTNRGFIEIKNTDATLLYTGSINGPITAAGDSSENTRHYEIPVTPVINSSAMFENQSDLTVVFTTGSSYLNKQRDVILMASPNGNISYDKDYYIGFIPYIPNNNNAFPGGKEPTDTAWTRPNLPWVVYPNDEIRFVNSEKQSYQIVTVTPPQQYQEQTGNFQLRLQLDRPVNNGININFFLIRRYITSYNSIIIDKVFPYGSLPQLTKWVDSKNTEIVSTGSLDSEQPWTQTYPASQSMQERASGSYISYTPPLRKQDNTPTGFFFPHFPVAEIELNPDETLKQLRDNKLIE
jgi:hypothetical protein